VTAVLEAHGLGKRYGRNWALSNCTLGIPAGHVVGLVGPNGAGKSTLLNLAGGLMAPSAGTIEVLGDEPGTSPEQLARVGFVAQGTPTYAGLSVADHLRLGAALNPRWDKPLADERIARLGLDPSRKAGKLSGGQRSQLALTLGIAKRPELLILDEPVAALDPLARREFLQGLMEAAVDQELSVILSSHLVSDLERSCDHLIVLVDSQVRLVGEVDELLTTHHRLTGPRRDPLRLPSDQHVVSASHTDRQTTLVVRSDGPIHDPTWEVSQLSLEDLVLAHMSETPPPAACGDGGAGATPDEPGGTRSALASVPDPGAEPNRDLQVGEGADTDTGTDTKSRGADGPAGGAGAGRANLRVQR
jgi:ABC-2 type transport system ATP-binding protein